MKKFFRNLFKKNARKNVEYYELKVYAEGFVKMRRYYGDDPNEAAARFMAKHGAKVASVESCNYYGNVVDFYYVNA